MTTGGGSGSSSTTTSTAGPTEDTNNSTGIDLSLLEKRLDSLRDTQDSVQGLSIWCQANKKYSTSIIDTWLRCLKKSPVEKRLTFFYLANDVVQHAKKKSDNALINQWAVAIQKAVPYVRTPTSISSAISRIFKIWEERSVYPKDAINDLLALLNAPAAKEKQRKNSASNNSTSTAKKPETYTAPAEKVHNFDPKEMLIKVKQAFKLRSHMGNTFRTKQYYNMKMDQLISSIKDRQHGMEIVQEMQQLLDECKNSEHKLQAEIEERRKLVEHTEIGIVAYENVRGEAGIVHTAYKNFTERIENTKKKIDEKLEDFEAMEGPPPPESMNDSFTSVSDLSSINLPTMPPPSMSNNNTALQQLYDPASVQQTWMNDYMSTTGSMYQPTPTLPNSTTSIGQQQQQHQQSIQSLSQQFTLTPTMFNVLQQQQQQLQQQGQQQQQYSSTYPTDLSSIPLPDLPPPPPPGGQPAMPMSGSMEYNSTTANQQQSIADFNNILQSVPLHQPPPQLQQQQQPPVNHVNAGYNESSTSQQQHYNTYNYNSTSASGGGFDQSTSHHQPTTNDYDQHEIHDQQPLPSLLNTSSSSQSQQQFHHSSYNNSNTTSPISPVRGGHGGSRFNSNWRGNPSGGGGGGSGRFSTSPRFANNNFHGRGSGGGGGGRGGGRGMPRGGGRGGFDRGGGIRRGNW